MFFDFYMYIVSDDVVSMKYVLSLKNTCETLSDVFTEFFTH